METLPWDEAKRELGTIDPPLAVAFDNIYQAADDTRRSNLTVAKASYSYGADVILWGTPKPDTGDSMPDRFILPTRLPLGIITRNGMEVLEAVVSRVPDKRTLETRLVPQALLGMRRLVGVFELLDWKTSGTAPDQADWNITAGSRTIYATERHNNNSVAKAVRRMFDADPKNTQTLFDWLSEIPAFVDEIKPAWQTDILYFANAWFDDDVRLDGTTTYHQPGPARELYHQLLERAWPTLSRLRPNSAVLYDVLREADDRENPSVIEAAFQLLDHWAAIRSGLRPCFAPTATDDDLGPFGAIVDRFLQPLLNCGSVLRPTYLSRGQTVGYLKLGHIAPVLFGSQIETNLRMTMTLIASATNRAIAMNNRAAERALGWPDMFNDLTFRFPPGDAQVKVPRTVRFAARVQARRPAYDPVPITEADFFSCYGNQPPPRQRSEFFTGSLRIAIGDD